MSIRAATAAMIAVAAVIVSGAIGIRTETAPGELACEFVGVSEGSDRTYPTAIGAAAGFAEGILRLDPDLIETNRGVIDVTGSATLGAEPVEGTVSAVRDHGRTVGFLKVHQDLGGWSVGGVELC